MIASEADRPLAVAPFTPGSVGETLNRPDTPLRFRQFLLLPSERALLFKGCPVEIGSRAFDLLTMLVRSRGKLVTKNDIVKYVWPSTLVEESNLRFQVATLRRALGNDRDMIKTIPGRGYLFVDERDGRSEGTVAPTGHPPAATLRSSRRDLHTEVIRHLGPDRRVAIIVVEGEGDLRETLANLLRSMDDLHQGSAQG
jgi:DNA-binding winged helix-turn-helix (wHTH) protein